jgi:hypothetical protein
VFPEVSRAQPAVSVSVTVDGLQLPEPLHVEVVTVRVREPPLVQLSA